MSILKNWFNKIFFLLIFLLEMESVNAQVSRINQLKIKLKNHSQNDSIKISLLSEISTKYRPIHPDSAIFYSKQLLAISDSLHHEMGRAYAYNNLAICEYIKANNELAKEYNKKALAINKKNNFRKGEANVLNNMAIIYHNEGKYDLALQFYTFSKAIREEINDQQGISDCYNNIANLYTDKGNYTEALKKLFEGLHIREQRKDTFAISNSYGNIAEVYSFLKKYKEAFHFSSTAYKLQKLIGDKEGMIQSSISIGSVYSFGKNYSMALKHFNEALQLSKETNNVDGMAVANTKLGETYSLLNNPDLAISSFNKANKTATQLGDIQGMAICELGIGQALVLKKEMTAGISHLEKGFKLAQSIHNNIHVYEGAQGLSEAYYKVGNDGKAYDYLKIQNSYKDSLFSEETTRKAHEIEFNYLLEKKQNEISLLEKDKSIQEEKHHFQQLLLIALGVLVCLLAVFLYFIHNFRLQETKAKDLIKTQKEEIETQKQNLEILNIYKNKTFSILSHDLRNPISTLSNFVNLMDQDVLSEEDFAEVRSNFRSQLKSISLLLENTLNWAKSQMSGELEPKKEHTSVREIVERNFDLFQQFAEEKKIQLRSDIPIGTTIWVDPNHLDIVLRNLIFNALKFTYPEGKIWVSSLLEKDKIGFQVKDTGQGMSEHELTNLFTYKMKQGNYGTNGESGAGIGLMLCKDFIERNNGQIKVNSKEKEGTEFIVYFPA